MGYLANIIKDSHLNPAGGSRLGLPLPDLDRQPWPDVTQTGEHIPGRPPRRLAGQIRRPRPTWSNPTGRRLKPTLRPGHKPNGCRGSKSTEMPEHRTRHPAMNPPIRVE